MEIRKTDLTVDEKSIYVVQLRKPRGISLTVTNLGAAALSLVLPDGKPGADILLGFPNLESQLQKGPMFGTTLGRYAGKILGGTYPVGDRTVALSRSHGAHHGHGGVRGFDKQVFDLLWAEDDRVCFRYVSADGEEGYPGTLTADVTYALTDRQTLELTYAVSSDKETVAGLSNHMYFNLSDQAAGSVLGHQLQVQAPWVSALDGQGLPMGALLEVAGTALDLRRPAAIGERLAQGHEQMARCGGLDLDYVFAEGRKTAAMCCPETGRRMTVEMDMPCVHLYVSNFGEMNYGGKDGAVYVGRCGVCFEPMYVSDCLHSGLAASPVLEAGAERRSKTVFSFHWEEK